MVKYAEEFVSPITVTVIVSPAFAMLGVIVVVLISAIVSIVIGILIFLPYIADLIKVR